MKKPSAELNRNVKSSGKSESKEISSKEPELNEKSTETSEKSFEEPGMHVTPLKEPKLNEEPSEEPQSNQKSSKEQSDNLPEELILAKELFEKSETNENLSEESLMSEKSSEQSEMNEKPSEKALTSKRPCEESQINIELSKDPELNEKTSEEPETCEKPSEQSGMNEKSSEEPQTNEKLSKESDTSENLSEEPEMNEKSSEDLETVHQKIAGKCELEKEKPDGNSFRDNKVDEKYRRGDLASGPFDGSVSKELEMDTDKPEEAERKDDATAEKEELEFNDVSNYTDGMGISPVYFSTGCILARHHCCQISKTCLGLPWNSFFYFTSLFVPFLYIKSKIHIEW